MAVHAESSKMAREMAGFQHMQLRDDEGDGGVGPERVTPRLKGDLRDGATDCANRFGAIPRLFTGETVGAITGGRKGKERARDASREVEDASPRPREIHDGITMWCTDDQPSPFLVRRSSFFAVDFDDNTFVDSVTFDNCVLLNVSFKGCILSDVRFMNLYLQDMEFIACDFHSFTWLSKGEFNQTWTDRTFEQTAIMGDTIPEEVSDPMWLIKMRETQVIPEKVETEPSAEYMRDLKLIHETVGTGWYTSILDADAEPGKFDFSKLGNVVYECYTSPAHETTVKRKMAEWEEFAEQQEQERQRERENEALQQAMAGSSIRSEVNFEVETKDTSGTAQPGTAPHPIGNAALKDRKDRFADLLTSAKAKRQPLQVASGNVQDFTSPVHPRGKGKVVHALAMADESDDEDELDEPVYKPAARFCR